MNPLVENLPLRRIAVAQLAFIGDMVFTTPLLRAIADQWPDAGLIVVGRPAAIELLEDHPGVIARLAYDKDARHRGVDGLRSVARELRAHAPDLFLGVSRSLRTALLARLSGARVRVGFAGFARQAFYTHRIARADRERRFPERPLALLEALGLPHPRAPRLDLHVAPARTRAAAEALQKAGWDGRPLMAVFPGANYATKRWPERHIATLLDLAVARGAFQPALYGGPAEDAQIERLLRGRGGVLDRRGIGLGGVAQELTLAAVSVSGDSGPAHIARALGTPAVVLHGPTDPHPLEDANPYHWIALGLDCQPCSPHGDARCPLGHHRCLEDLLPELVLEHADRIARRG